MIIQLESREELTAIDLLRLYIDEARQTHDRNLIRRIRRLWRYDRFGRRRKHGDKWKDILAKLDDESSRWYVYVMDGVHEFMRSRLYREGYPGD